MYPYKISLPIRLVYYCRVKQTNYLKLRKSDLFFRTSILINAFLKMNMREIFRCIYTYIFFFLMCRQTADFFNSYRWNILLKFVIPTRIQMNLTMSILWQDILWRDFLSYAIVIVYRFGVLNYLFFFRYKYIPLCYFRS